MKRKDYQKALYQAGLPYYVTNKLSVKEMKEIQKGGNILSDLFTNVSNDTRMKALDDPNQHNKKIRLLKKGEKHVTFKKDGQVIASNFMGPGTRIDLPEVMNFPPYNKSDEAAKYHDIDYQFITSQNDLSKDQKSRMIRQSDINLIDRLRSLPSDELKDIGIRGMQAKMTLENKTPYIAKKILGNYYGRN